MASKSPSVRRTRNRIKTNPGGRAYPRAAVSNRQRAIKDNNRHSKVSSNRDRTGKANKPAKSKDRDNRANKVSSRDRMERDNKSSRINPVKVRAKVKVNKVNKANKRRRATAKTADGDRTRPQIARVGDAQRIFSIAI